MNESRTLGRPFGGQPALEQMAAAGLSAVAEAEHERECAAQQPRETNTATSRVRSRPGERRGEGMRWGLTQKKWEERNQSITGRELATRNRAEAAGVLK